MNKPTPGSEVRRRDRLIIRGEIALRYRDAGMQQKEIAVLLDCTVRTVRRMLVRANDHRMMIAARGFEKWRQIKCKISTN